MKPNLASSSTPSRPGQTGPKSRAGKASVSLNALKHGLLSQRLFLPGEDPGEFQAIFDALAAEHRPANLTETVLVEKLAICLWRQKRLVATEAAQIELRQSRHSYQVIDATRRILGLRPEHAEAMMARAAGLGDAAQPDDDADFSDALQVVQHAMGLPEADDRLLRYQAAADNQFYKTLRALREAQAWRLEHAPIEVINPVSSN